MCKISFLRDAQQVDFQGWNLAFGVFDGVHRGHQFLIGQARDAALRNGGKSGVLTFSVDPDELFGSGGLFKLMTNSERLFALASTGVDTVFVLPFDYDFASKAPEDFLDWTFGAGAPSLLHVGEGFRFGCMGSGTVEDLAVWGTPRGMGVCEHPLLWADGGRVSSTRIRGLLLEGRFEEAFSLMGPLPADICATDVERDSELLQVG